MKREPEYRQPPRSAMEVFDLLPEGTWCEVVENQLYMRPIPNLKHQQISGVVSLSLYNYVEKNNVGEAYGVPLDVRLEPGKNAFQPDIVFVSNENSEVLTERGIDGVPDLIIEILSPGNEAHDTVRKKAVYQRCGVKELWYVDPMKRNVYGFALKNGKYVSLGKASKTISFRLLDLKIDLSKEL